MSMAVAPGRDGTAGVTLREDGDASSDTDLVRELSERKEAADRNTRRTDQVPPSERNQRDQDARFCQPSINHRLSPTHFSVGDAANRVNKTSGDWGV